MRELARRAHEPLRRALSVRARQYVPAAFVAREAWLRLQRVEFAHDLATIGASGGGHQFGKILGSIGECLAHRTETLPAQPRRRGNARLERFAPSERPGEIEARLRAHAPGV